MASSNDNAYEFVAKQIDTAKKILFITSMFQFEVTTSRI